MARALPFVLALSLAAAPALPAFAEEGEQAQSGLIWSLPNTPWMPLAVSPEAASWRPALIESVDAYLPAPPPAHNSDAFKADMAAVKALQAKRTPEEVKTVFYWNNVPTPLRWSETADREIAAAGLTLPRAARALALVHAAMYDATLVAWKAKGKYQRALPYQANPYLKAVAGEPGIPSYPSEQAAIAMAAATVLAELCPEHKDALLQRAEEAGQSRVVGGAAYPTDVEAGYAIGRRVADAVLKARADDGSAATRNPLFFWTPPAEAEAGAGGWKPFLLDAGGQFRLPAPAKAVPMARATEADALGAWNETARQAAVAAGSDAPRSARLLSVLAQTEADAVIATWDSRYARSAPAGWPDAGAVLSVAACKVLEKAYPTQAERFRAQAEPSARSGGGAAAGLGEKVGMFDAGRAAERGWLP